MDDAQHDSALNDLAWDLVHQVMNRPDEMRIDAVSGFAQGILLDFGVDAPGSLSAGLALIEVCMSGLCHVNLLPGGIGGIGWPILQVQTDNPIEACLLSQYGGWKIKTDDYFAIGSGPMRAAAAKELLFEKLEYREHPHGVVGVLESSELPGPDVLEMIAEECQVDPDRVALLVAPTSSLAGTMQVVARSVETAIHKLTELDFDVTQIESATGWAPVPPVGGDEITAIGRTNDAILYGGQVTLWVTGEDDEIASLGPRIPSCSSEQYGRPFAELFKKAGHDFYKMDPLLFSPAQVVLHNVETGRVHHFGKTNEQVLKDSFGLR